MANERVYTVRNVGDEDNPIWEVWFAVTVADAVMMSDKDGETQTIVDYVNGKIADLIGGAPATYDTLKEIADYISSHKDVSDALNAAIANKADKSIATSSADGLMPKGDKAKIDGIEPGANNYIHPANHPASMVTQDSTHRFVTDAEKTKWNGAPTIGFGSSYPASAPNNSVFYLIKS